MVQMRSILEVADNSGAKKIAMILPLGGNIGSRASVGDVITASVKEANPDGTVKKKQVVKAVNDELCDLMGGGAGRDLVFAPSGTTVILIARPSVERTAAIVLAAKLRGACAGTWSVIVAGLLSQRGQSVIDALISRSRPSLGGEGKKPGNTQD